MNACGEACDAAALLNQPGSHAVAASRRSRRPIQLRSRECASRLSHAAGLAASMQAGAR